jgi:hypothetical protein
MSKTKTVGNTPMKMLLLKLLLIGVGHIGLGCWLFRLRALYKGIAIFHWDFLVIALPALTAFALNTCVLRGAIGDWLPRASPIAASLGLALILAIASEALLLYIAFNRFGT